jgi:hypothetical protein
MKIPELKRSRIGIIVGFSIFPTGLPNQAIVSLVEIWYNNIVGFLP